MKLLLTGEVRFKGDALSQEEWVYKNFKEVFERVERSVHREIEYVLSITAKVGFVDQSKKFGRVIAGKNLENYTHLLRGEFAYNKGNSKSYPQGCIYRLDEFEEGAVPNVYYCFRAASESISADFYKYYFESGALNEQLRPIINAGVRNDGLLNISADDFFDLIVVVPPLEAQEYIAEFLQYIDLEIELMTKQFEALERQKRGLMQQLLTGALRVEGE
jgi:type I restriction enzyme, S subunit